METDAVQARLRAMGCDIAQGYGICRPLDVEKMTRWLSQRSADVKAGATGALAEDITVLP